MLLFSKLEPFLNFTSIALCHGGWSLLSVKGIHNIFATSHYEAKKHISLLIILNDNVLILIWRNIKRTFYSANHKAPKILFMSFACNFAMVSKQTLTHWINHELKYVYDELYFFPMKKQRIYLKYWKETQQ